MCNADLYKKQNVSVCGRMIVERCWQIILSPPCYVLKCRSVRWIDTTVTESADSGLDWSEVTNNHLFQVE